MRSAVIQMRTATDWRFDGSVFLNWVRLTAILAVLSCVFPAAGQQPSPQKANRGRESPEEKLTRLIDEGRYREAEQALLNTLPNDDRPLGVRSLATLRLLTSIYLKSEYYQQSVKWGRRFLELYRPAQAGSALPKQYQLDVASMVAESLACLGRFQEAAQCCNEALEAAAGDGSLDVLFEPRLHVQLAQVLVAEAKSKKRDKVLEAEGHWQLAEKAARMVFDRADKGIIDKDQYQVPAADVVMECCLATNRPAEAIKILRQLEQAQMKDNRGRQKTLANIARCYQQMGDRTKEKELLKDALSVSQPSAKAKAMIAAAGESITTGEKKKHIADAVKTIVAAAELHDRLAQACDYLGDESESGHHWKESARHYEDMNAAHNTAVHLALQMRNRQELERIYQKLRDWEAGRHVTEKLLEYRVTALLPEDPRIFRARAALGGFCAKLSNEVKFKFARPQLEEALRYWEKRQPEELSVRAATYNNLGEVQRAAGEHGAARDNFASALRDYNQILPENSLTLAEIHINLGTVLAARGNYQQAREEFKIADKICGQHLQKKSRRMGTVKSVALLNWSLLEKAESKFAKAAKLCREALDTRQQVTKTDAADLLPYRVTLATFELALSMEAAENKNEKAEDVHLQEAQDLAEKAREGMNQAESLPIEVHYVLGMVHLRLGSRAEARVEQPKARQEYEQALESWKKCKGIANTSGQLGWQARSACYLAEIKFRQTVMFRNLKDNPLSASELQDADRLSAEAVKLLKDVQAYPNLYFMAQVTRARVLYLRKRTEEALLCLEAAIARIELPRAAVQGGDSVRAAYFSQFVPAYDLLVEWNIDLKRYEKALEFADASRNRIFLDQIDAAGVPFRKALAETDAGKKLLEDERKALEVYAVRQRDVRKAVAAKKDIFSAALALEGIQMQLAGIQERIRDASPFYHEAIPAGATPTDRWKHVRESLASNDDAVLWFHVGEHCSWLFLIMGGEVSYNELRISVDEARIMGPKFRAGTLTRAQAVILVSQYMATISDEEFAGRGLKIDGLPVDPTLWNVEQLAVASRVLLPQKVRDRVLAAKPGHVIVVPDGALHQLPLEALVIQSTPELRYVLDVFPPMTYAPSAMIMAALKSRGSAVTAVSVLSVGDPSYPEGDADGRSRRRRRTSLPEDLAELKSTLQRLPKTAVECNRVQSTFTEAGGSPDIVEKLLQADATEQRVRLGLKGRQFVHFATHGLVDQRNQNMFGALALTPPPQSDNATENDGFLYLYEIHDLPLTSCELAVLSACETNVGPDRPLEAGSTMARAFLAAGARRVIASHWRVDDESTAALIGNFFDNLRPLRSGHPQDYAAALHEARRQVRNDKQNPQWAEPYYWAPFVLIGPAQ